MSTLNFVEYIKQLKEKASTLMKQLKDLDNQILQQNMAFEISKNDLRDDAANVASSYKPSSLDLTLPKSRQIASDANEINQILDNFFKV